MDTAHRGDTISRQLAVEELEHIMGDHPLRGYEDEQLLINAVKSLPSADRPTGEWVLKESEDGVYWWHECSECGEKPLLDRWMHDEKLSDFCWNCGSKMFKGGDTE